MEPQWFLDLTGRTSNTSELGMMDLWVQMRWRSGHCHILYCSSAAAWKQHGGKCMVSVEITSVSPAIQDESIFCFVSQIQRFCRSGS